MNRLVVTHHWRAWWRSHRATSRWTAGSGSRHRSGRGGKWMAGAPPATRGSTLAQLQPEQKAVRQHHSSSMAVETRPQPALVLIPAQLTFGLFMELFDRIATMGIACQLFPRGCRRQVAPVVFPFLGLPARGPLAQQPAHMPLPVAGHPPAAHRHKLLAQPPLGALAPADGPPLPAGQRPEQVIGPLPRACRSPLLTHPEVGAHAHYIALLSTLQACQSAGRT